MSARRSTPRHHNFINMQKTLKALALCALASAVTSTAIANDCQTTWNGCDLKVCTTNTGANFVEIKITVVCEGVAKVKVYTRLQTNSRPANGPKFGSSCAEVTPTTDWNDNNVNSCADVTISTVAC